MKSIFKLLLVAVILGFIACSGGGFKKTDSGLSYKFYTKKDSAKPVEGDVITAQMVYKIVTASGKDSTIFDSRNNPSPFKIPLAKPEYPGDIYEGLALMGSGDSATFVIKADSFFVKTARSKLPPFVKPGSDMHFDVKLLGIMKKAEYEKQQKEAMDKQMKAMEEMKGKEQIELQDYIAKNNIKVKPTESGLYFVEVKKGSGTKAEKGKKVTVDYKGMLLNGTVFDASKSHDKPFEFTIGHNEVIPGWDEGISMMKKGGKAKIIIPSKLGYGSSGAGATIPPFSPLVFEVELLDVK
ncbi:MAG: FKBP-type peptidyl-prolyl cis-trans isomerase [Bacteroidota bacterium]